MRTSRFRSLSAEEFRAHPPSAQVIVHEFASRYAEIVIGTTRVAYALSWKSDIIEPVCIVHGNDTWLGVDEKVVCIDSAGHVAFSLTVGGNLLLIKPLEGCVAVLSDGDLTLVNADWSIRELVTLVETPRDVQVVDGRIVVVGIDGGRLNVGRL